MRWTGGPAAEDGPEGKAGGDRQWSPGMQELYAMAAQMGASEAPVLIQGETGSGKEVLARHVHAHSKRANRPFLKLNCAALPSELVESELFGYERGAFTGAFQRKPGMFEIADGGTLLLDEIGDMDFPLQAKLLQVLQDHEFQRLGGKETLRVDVRVIAATHKDLEKAIAAGQFRQDLYYRLNVVALHVPPLRDRKEDILGLAELLMQKYVWGEGPAPEITPALQQALLLHDWPGNVRELENCMRKLLVLQDADLIARELTARAARKALTTAPILDLPAQSQAGAGERAYTGAGDAGQTPGGDRSHSGGPRLHALEPQEGGIPAENRLQSAAVQNEETRDRG